MPTKSSRKAAGKKPIAPTGEPRLVSLLAEVAGGQGYSSSHLPGLKFMRSNQHVARNPTAYDPSIVIIAQGRKTGYFGGKQIGYDANNYAESRFAPPLCLEASDWA